MFRLDKKVWLFLLLYMGIIVVSSLILAGKIDSFYKIGLYQGFSLMLFVLIFSSRKLVIGLRPNFKISGLKYIVPIFIALLLYALIRTDFLNRGAYSYGYIGLLLFIVFIQTLTEEVIFRGLVLNELLAKNYGISKAIIYSSILFGLLHIIAIFGKTPVESVINQVIIACMLGVFLGSVFVLSKNIYVAGICHMFINIPGYFNQIKTQPETSELDLNLLEHTSSFLEIILSTVMLILVYSPFLFVGVFLISKAKKKQGYEIKIQN